MQCRRCLKKSINNSLCKRWLKTGRTPKFYHVICVLITVKYFSSNFDEIQLFYWYFVSWALLLLFYEFYFPWFAPLVQVSPTGCTYELGKAVAGTAVLAGPKVAKLVPLAPLLICYNYCSIRVYKHFFSLGISTVAI